jgi:Protein of unknown function (DUF1822)
MKCNNLSSFKIDLDRISHEYAAKFAAAQTSVAKGQKVYLNTLAVCAVRQYLSCGCELDLDLSQGDSWQVGLQSIMNVADLVIPNVGKIECLVLLPNTTEIQIPPATIDERIGYVIVQFGEDLNSVEILGFIDRLESEITSVDLARLQPLDDLLDVIYSVRINNLREFLVGKFGTGWEPIENLIGIPNQEFALRNTISLPTNTSYDNIRDFIASKMINLRANIANIPLLMMIGLGEEADGRVKVRIRLHAAGGVPALPAHLKLTLQAENGRVLSEIQYPEAMNFIQLQSFKLLPGTQFKIRVELDNSSFTESFVA